MTLPALPEWFELDYASALHFYRFTLREAEKVGEAAVIDARRRLAEADLFFFLIDILRRSDLMHEWLYDRCREVQREPDGRLDLWARSHYKSTIITFALTIWDVLHDPELTFGIFSFNKSIAKDFLRQIKTELESNEVLAALWPDVFYADPQSESDRWSIDNGINVKRKSNPKEATIEGHGLVDGMPTGRHFKRLVYDDVVTMDGVNTPQLIEKTTQAFQMSDNLGSEGDKRRYIGTRYHLFDTYGTMIDEETAIIRIHAATKDGKATGEPVLLSRETLADKLKKQGQYVFSSQMLLNPVADASMGFKREWLTLGDTDPAAAMRSLWRFIIVDPSSGRERKNGKKSKGKEGDYTTIWVIGYGHDEQYRVLDIRRDRMSLTQRTEALFELHAQWKPGLVAYEEYGMQADIEHIKFVQKQRLYEFDITPLGGGMRKELRILRLVPYFENGYKSVADGGDGESKSRIVLPISCVVQDYQGISRDLVKDFIEQEYVAFPVLKHDDMIDGLARIIDLEEKGLIEKPNVRPATLTTPNKVADGLRKAAQAQGGSDWITA